MIRITFSELRSFFLNLNDFCLKEKAVCPKAKATAIIVYKQENFKKEYTTEQLSYRVSNNNRMFQLHAFSNSLFGDCLDGIDLGVRLDLYDWKVDYCYIEKVELEASK